MTEHQDSKFETSSVFSLFPTTVWQTVLKEEIAAEISNQLLQTFDQETGALDDAGSGGSWQSERNLHGREELKPLTKVIGIAVDEALEHLKVVHRGYEITGCWINVNGKGTAHRVHAHPNNFLSGVYYVQTQQGADTINFHDPRVQTAIIRPPVSKLTGGNTDQVVVQVRNGMLLLFPSWLQHSVDPNNSEQTRISVSFNVMFSSYAGTMSKPLW